MLPDDFHWRHALQGEWLWLGEQHVASYIPGDPYTLLYLREGTARCSGFTVDSPQAAKAYIEAWTTKWAPEIRELYGVST